MKKFIKRALSKQLALAGWLGASTIVFQGYVQAADYGTRIASNITLNDGDTVTANAMDIGGFWTGISDIANMPTTIDLGTGSKVVSNSTSAPVKGIFIQGDNARLNANNLTLEVKGGFTTALYVYGNNAQVDLGSGGSISVEGNNVPYAIEVTSKASVKANGININVKSIGSGGTDYVVRTHQKGASLDLGTGSSITTDGFGAGGVIIASSGGIAADESAKFSANALTINTLQGNSAGLDIQPGAIANLGHNSSITTNGNNSRGIWVVGGTLSADNSDGLRISTKGTDSVALFAQDGGVANVGVNSHLSATNSGTLVARGASAVVNFKGSATQRNTIFSGADYGASAQNSGVVNLENTDITVDRNGGRAYAVWAGGGDVNAINTSVTGASNVYGVVANGGKVTFTGETIISMASANEVAMISAGAGNKISATGKINITGSVYAQSNSITDLNMTQGSVLTGGAFAVSGGTANLTLDDSRWNMTQDSLVSKLALNNSTVNFAENRTGSILSVGNLSGNGTFIMQVDMVGDGVTSVGDKLVVTGTSSGNHRITAQNRGSLATTGNEVLTVVETADGGALFAMTNQVELGGYLYDVRRAANGDDWELYSSGKYSPPVPAITPAADTSASFLNAGYLLNYAQTQTLLQRMGDLRQSENSEGDVWARAYTGKFDSFGGGKLSGFDMDYTGVQTGVDARLNINSGELYLGAMGGISQADPNYVSGDGDLTGYHLGMYGTYVMDNDFYVDGVLKYNHLKNKFNNVQDTQGNLIDGDASSDGYGVSVEVGKRFYWNATRSGYYIEPQAQLSYTHQGSATTRASNGLVTEMDSYDSTIGRISGLIGYEIKDGANPVNVYFKTGYVTEMSGDAGYSLNGSKEHNDFGGDWWENGVGVTAQINKQHNLYLDGKYATGSKFDQMQINAGYRYSF